MERKVGLIQIRKTSREKRKSKKSSSSATSGEYEDNLVVRCEKYKHYPSWETLGEYKDDQKIMCVLSKKYIYEEKEENRHTGLMDEADGLEYDNTPAKANKDLSTEVGPKQKYPYTGVMLCMPCNDGESISSISTSEKASKIGEVDSIVNELLQSPEHTIKTMQEVLKITPK